MHPPARFSPGRLERFVRERLRPAVYRRRVPARVTAWAAPGEPVPFAHAIAQRFEPVAPGDRWGRPWGTTWLHVVAEIPADWDAGDDPIELVVDLGFTADRPGFQAEGLVHTIDGRLVKAVEPRNPAVPVNAAPGETVELWIEAASNPDIASAYTFAPTPLGDPLTAGVDPLYVFGGIDVAIRDTVVWELDQDLAVLAGILAHTPEDRPRHAEIAWAVTRVLDEVGDDVAGRARGARAILADVLGRPAHASAHRVFASGHAHIDSAWLWPTRETIRKCARTFSNVLHLMDADPDFVFACSSAQQLEWIREAYPDLFARILDRVRDGRFIPVGGMWVEADTNMPGSEAMARQFVEGGSFFREVLGVEAREVWLPDSFGYSAGLPQIARAAGARWFLSQKLSWNDTNTMPHHTFWWEGHDGSRVLAHFPPADTYNSDVSVADLDRAERQFADKGPASSSLLLFGWGDGGGGPTREMLAAAHRSADLEGVPRVRLTDPATFFADAEAEYGALAPTWSGELYLELHRGVYTSQARTKLGNRQSEQALHDAELWATTAMVRAGTEYPGERLRRLWRRVLLAQFHDILPGSSIAWVHREAEDAYAEILAEARAIADDAIVSLVGPGDRPLTVVSSATAADGRAAMSITEGAGAPAAVVPVRDGDAWVLDNGVLAARIDADGLLSSCVHRPTGRELLLPGMRGAVPQLLHDVPEKWDAWDVAVHDRASATDLIVAESVRSDGTAVEVERLVSGSRLVQRYALLEGASALELEVAVDWQERRRALKLAFPLDVHAERFSAQTQFGHVERSTHANTSWEAARFEVCAHRFVHVAEPGFGVALVNEATYGHDVTRVLAPSGASGTLVRATLLRSSEFPDPDADRGTHRRAFRLVVGDIETAVAHGYTLAAPARVVTGERGVAPLVTVEGAIIETVKAAQDGSGDVIVRFYEHRGMRSTAVVGFGFPFSRVVETDLHERELAEQALVTRDAEAVLALTPFAMRTLRVSR